MEDHKIVQLYWERNEKAIPATISKYGKYCNSIAKNILGNREEAEECVNDTYFRAWSSMPPHKPRNLSTFLGKLTRNLSLNRYKHLTAMKRGNGQAALVLDELAECVADRENVEQEIERKELVKAINSFLAKLSVEKRRMFVCRYWYFDSIDEIAVRFGKSKNQVSVTLSRIRTQLYDFLQERGYEI